jgi:hypothetical protein
MNKRVNEEKKTSQPDMVEAIELSEETVPIDSENELKILYVNSREGLRVRDEPSLSGNRQYLLAYKEPVIVIEKSNVTVDIDGITDHWYLISNDNTKGWVFGGYLSDSLIEIERNEFPGIFYFLSVDIRKKNNIRKTQLDQYFLGTDKFFIEIDRIDNEIFLLKNNTPFSLGAVYQKNNVQFKYPPEKTNWWNPGFQENYDGVPFYEQAGEKGGGGTYIYLFHNKEQIIMDYLYRQSFFDDDFVVYSEEQLEFQMIFEKKIK